MQALVDPTAVATGWQAGLGLGLSRRADRTVLADRCRHGPLAVQRAFYPEGTPCHVYLLHPPGGVVGGDVLVRGAVGVARRLRVSPLVIGLTLVGFGTSMPELVTSIDATLADAEVGDVITHLGRRHRPAHCLRGLCYRVRPEVKKVRLHCDILPCRCKLTYPWTPREDPIS